MGINVLLYVVWFFCGIYGAISQGDSLRSALNAVDRKQRYYLLEDYPLPVPFYRENAADFSYLPESLPVGGNDLAEYYFDRGEDLGGQQISSSFRERLEDREKELEGLQQRGAISMSDYDDSFDNIEYRSKDPWKKFRNNPQSRNERLSSGSMRKRQFYPGFGYDSIGLRKREQSDYQNEYNYRSNYNDDYPNDYTDSIDFSGRLTTPLREDKTSSFVRSNGISHFRHIPVSKRSSENTDQQSRRKPTSGTDPKIAKELSSVFAGSDKEKSKKKEESKGKGENRTGKDAEDEKKKTANKTLTEKAASKSMSEKPIQVTKKSIDWSTYFGLDRRKKSQDDINKERMMDRYHKAMAASKKSANYPLQSFHSHEGSIRDNNMKNDSDSLKLENMDVKLKIIEDEIVDDALKFTGANEGVTDAREIQEVKDGIIARLSKAYSIDKMRRALDEYRRIVEKERQHMGKKEEAMEKEYMSEDKRISVPRKQAVEPDKDVQVEDNHIKCTGNHEDCNEENHKTPIELVEQLNYEFGGCPKIQKDCNQVAFLLGDYAKIFEEACNIHQKCLLCGNNSWYPATRQCNILFSSKVLEMCEGNTDCQKELQKSVRHLMNISRNLRNIESGECNIICPDGIDNM